MLGRDQILAALAKFDSATMDEIREVLRMTDDLRSRNRLAAHLSRMVATGAIEIAGPPKHRPRYYRIKPRGFSASAR